MRTQSRSSLNERVSKLSHVRIDQVFFDTLGSRPTVHWSQHISNVESSNSLEYIYCQWRFFTNTIT